MKTTVRADAKLQNLPPAALDELWALRHPEEEGTRPWTLTAVAAWIPGRFGFTVAVSAVGTFYQWLELKMRMDKRAAAVEQFKQRLAKDKSFTSDQLKEVGQKLFMSDGILDNNAKVFLGAVESVQNDERLKQNDTKLKLAKEKVEIDKRKLAILEKKAAQADAAAKVSGDGALTPEEKAARLKQIFGMG